VRRPSGFILATTLWILAAIALAFGYLATWSQQALTEAQQGREAFRQQLARHDTLATLLYALASRRVTFAGLSGQPPLAAKTLFTDERAVVPTGDELRLDDRPYRGFGDVCFSIQDEGGLIGLNLIDERLLGKLLGLLDVPLSRRPVLIATLRDYIDENDAHRLNGAEAFQYRRRRLSPPPNRFLLTTWEVYRVMGWARHESLWRKDRLPRLTTVMTGGLPNFNTAPLRVLQAMPALTAADALKIQNARERRPFRSLADVTHAIGHPLPIDPMDTRFLASAYWRISLWSENGSTLVELHVKLTPLGREAPWIIDHVIYRSSSPDLAACHAFPVPWSLFDPALSPDS